MLTSAETKGIIKMYRKKGTHRKETVNGSKIIDKPTYNKIIKPILKKVLMLESLQMNGYND